MKTHQEVLYHCLACGAVSQAGITDAVRQCCGHPMVLAAQVTVKDEEERPHEPLPSPRRPPPKG